MIKRRTFGNFLADRKGVGTIEFVATLPMFLAALALAFEFGMIFLAHQSTVNNVRAAARFLARAPATNDSRAIAANIIRTGEPVGGIVPDFMDNICNPARRCITRDFDEDGNLAGYTISLRVNYPLTIFNFAERKDDPFNDAPGGISTIPFAVRESVRWSGF